jgi:hypothetical protein
LRTDREMAHDENLDVPPGRFQANEHDDRPGAKLSSRYAQPIRIHKDKVEVRDKRARADQKTAGKAGEKQAERSGAFAKGGRVKGKNTTVNVIVAPQGGQAGAGGPPPMGPPPMMPPPQPPPRPPMPPPGAGGGAPPNVNIMPSGGAPMGAAGAPPPGVPPGMRKRGGRVVIPQAPSHQGRGKFPKSAPAKEGHADFGRAGKRDFGPGGTPSKAHVKQTAGAGGGLGRIEKARREA